MTDDAIWFERHPHREFRCRLLESCEREAQDAPPAGSIAVRIIYVRKSDGAAVKAWTCHPDLLIAEEDEGRARFFSQWMSGRFVSNGDPIQHVEPIAVSPEVATAVLARIADASNPEKH